MDREDDLPRIFNVSRYTSDEQHDLEKCCVCDWFGTPEECGQSEEEFSCPECGHEIEPLAIPGMSILGQSKRDYIFKGLKK